MKAGSPETALVPLKHMHIPSSPTRAVASWTLSRALGISEPPRGRQQEGSPPPLPASLDPGPGAQMREAEGDERASLEGEMAGNGKVGSEGGREGGFGGKRL